MGKFRELESRTQIALLPRSIEEFVSVDDGVRWIDEVIEELDLSDIECAYSENGRPGYAPRVLVKILAYGTVRGIRSSRELARAARENLRFIFLAQGEQPDFRTISDFRKRFHKELGSLLAQTVRIGLKEGLVSLNQVAIDGTKIRGFAGANSFKSRELLERELGKLERDIEEALSAGIVADEKEDKEQGDGDGDLHIPPTLRGKQDRREKILKAVEELKKTSGTTRKKASSTDPDCRFMKKQPCYNAQAAVDVQSGMVVGAYVTSNNNDTRELRRNVEEVVATTEKTPNSVVADAGYGTYGEIAQTQGMGVDVYVPIAVKGRGAQDFFDYDSQSDTYLCKGGRILRTRGRSRNKLFYSTSRCAGCSLRSRCVPHRPEGTERFIGVHVYEHVAQQMRIKMKGHDAQEAMRHRRCSVEPLFGVVKYCRKLYQFILRSLPKVDSGWKFEMAVHNITKLALQRA